VSLGELIVPAGLCMSSLRDEERDALSIHDPTIAREPTHSVATCGIYMQDPEQASGDVGHIRRELKRSGASA
jgi:hypothetical protein